MLHPRFPRLFPRLQRRRPRRRSRRQSPRRRRQSRPHGLSQPNRKLFFLMIRRPPRSTQIPPHSTPQTEPQSLTEAPLPEPPSIDTSRVVVNQSNVAVHTGGSSSSRSIVDSAAAHLVVQQGATGLEIASLDVKPGWIEAARAESPTEITLHYVLGSSAVDIRIWANGAGISSSVSASSDR